MHKYQRIHDLSPLSLKLLNDQIEELWRTVMIKFDEVEKQALADLIEQNNDLSGFLLEAEADRDRWKARAEALESRYNELWDDATSGAFLQCPTCGNRNKGITPSPCRDCIGVRGNWKWRHEERSGEK